MIEKNDILSYSLKQNHSLGKTSHGLLVPLKMNVIDDSTFLKADIIVKKLIDAASQCQGFLRAQRTVCKEEWDYEGMLIFDSQENFN